MEKSDILCILFMLFSFLILTDIFIFFRSDLSNLIYHKSTILLFILSFGMISLIVFLISDNSLRFNLLFWNSILAAVIGSISFYVYKGNTAISMIFAGVILVYAGVVIIFMNRIVNKRRRTYFIQTAY